MTFEKLTSDPDIPQYKGSSTEDFTINCLVSASNIDGMQLYFNGKPADKDDFIQTETHVPCDCDHGLKTARELNTTWRASEREFNCETVTYYDGDYQCIATATTAGVTKIETSSVLSASAQCKLL